MAEPAVPRAELENGLRRLTSGVAAAMWLLLAAGCAELSLEEPASVPSITRPGVLGEMQVDVDARTGEVRFTAIGSGASLPQSVRAQIYGDQNVNVRLFNAPPSIVTTATLKTLTANVGIQNLRPHPIGDEQGSIAPPDTMGIFVFFTTEPVVTQTSGSCSGTCFVRIANQRGSATFDQPNRKYMYWPERIREQGNILGDSSARRMPWIFEMSPQVTNFQFFVLLSAAWPAPFETMSRWKVEYRPDSIPNLGTEPLWKVLQSGTGGTWSTNGTSLNMRGNPFGQTFFVRRDSVLSTTDAWIEASVSVMSGSTNPQAGLGFTDGTRVVAIAMGRGRAGFVDYLTASYVGTPITLANGTHVYQLRKYAADSAVLYVDGTRRAQLAYSSLRPDPFAATLSPQTVWGTGFNSTGTSTNWQFVRYEIGSATP